MATVGAQNSLRELNKFENTVLYALELYDSIEDLLSYCFGTNGSLQNVLSIASKEESQIDECSEVIRRLLRHIEQDLTSVLTGNGSLSHDEELVVAERFKLFWEIYKCRSVDKTVSVETLCELDSVMEKIEKFINTSKNFPISKLPISLLEHFHKDSAIAPKQFQPFYIREDVNLMAQSTHDTKPETAFLQSFEKLIQKLKKDDYDRLLMKNLAVDQDFEQLKLSKGSLISVISSLVPFWSNIFKQEHFEVPKSFCHLLSKIFDCSAMEDKNIIFEAIFGKNGPSSGELHNYEEYLLDYSTRLASTLNSLGDHNTLQSDVEKFKGIAQKMLFLIFVSPYNTIDKVLQHCVDNRTLVPGVMKVLHACSILFRLNFTSTNGKNQPLLISIIEKMFERESSRFGSTEYQYSFVYLLTTLCRRKLAVFREKGPDGRFFKETYGEVIEDSLVDSSDLFHQFILPRVLSTSLTEFERITLLKTIQRVIHSVHGKDTKFKWTCSIGANWKGTHSVPAPELMLLAHGFYSQYEQRDQAMADVCRDILKTLGIKLKDDNVVFCAKTTIFIVNKLARDPWWVKYAIVEWFGHALSYPKHQIPMGIFHSLPLEQQEKFEQIAVDFESSPVSCFLRSIFELGLYDTEMALSLLKNGLALTPSPDLLVEQIALALTDSAGRSFSSVRISALGPLLARLNELMGPFHCDNSLKFLSSFTFFGLQYIQPLLIIAKATQIAFAKKEQFESEGIPYIPQESLDKVADPHVIAQEFLQAFCEMTKAHLESEMVLVRRYKHDMTSGFAGGTETVISSPQFQRPAIVSIQLSVLFSQAVMFTQLSKTEIIPSLRVLISLLSDYIVEINERQKTRYLNDINLPFLKPKTVYAYAASTDNSKGNDETENAQGMPDCKSSKLPLTAENRLFDAENTGVSIMQNCRNYNSIASQIGDLNIKTQMEKRLDGITNKKNTDVSSSQQDAQNQKGSDNPIGAKRSGKKRNNNKKRF